MPRKNPSPVLSALVLAVVLAAFVWVWYASPAHTLATGSTTQVQRQQTPAPVQVQGTCARVQDLQKVYLAKVPQVAHASRAEWSAFGRAWVADTDSAALACVRETGSVEVSRTGEAQWTVHTHTQAGAEVPLATLTSATAATRYAATLARKAGFPK